MASVFMDRVVGLVTLASLAVILGLVFDREALGPALYFLAAIPVASVIGIALLRVPQLARSSLLSKGILGRVVKPMLEYVADPRGIAVLAKSTAVSFAVSALQLVVIRLFVLAFDAAPTHEAWVFMGTTFGMMVAAVPMTPGGWGTADATYVVFFGRAGIAASVAAACCLLYRVSWYASAVLGAALTLSRRKS